MQQQFSRLSSGTEQHKKYRMEAAPEGWFFVRIKFDALSANREENAFAILRLDATFVMMHFLKRQRLTCDARKSINNKMCRQCRPKPIYEIRTREMSRTMPHTALYLSAVTH